MVRDFFMEGNKMTEEIQNSAVDNTETANTESKEITMHTYYWSNDDVPFRILRTDDEIKSNQYPIVVSAPDPNLKAPKYDWMNNKWIETSEESFGQRLTEAVETIKNIQNSVTTLQEAEQNNVKNTEQSNTAMEQMQKTIQMSNRMMGTLSSTVAALTKAYQDVTKPTENTTETKQGDAE